MKKIETIRGRVSQKFQTRREIQEATKKRMAKSERATQKEQAIRLGPAEQLAVMADKSRLKEVFENLLSNALKYSYSSTAITINVTREGSNALVSFQDQGQGLSESDMKKLFTKLARLSAVPTGKERSTGLGLSIVKALVELHGGKVWASSTGKNQGATFFVSLPLSPRGV